jgi:hypothetical protein
MDTAEYKPDDVNSVKILLCCLLHSLDSVINADELYDIAVDSGIINYFYYNEAIEELLKNDTIISALDDNGKTCFSLGEKGELFVKEFASYVELSLRKRLVYEAFRYKAKKMQNASLSLDYRDCDEGCRLVCGISDGETQVMELTLLTHSRTQAELIGERISDNPLSFYNDIINYSIQKRLEPDKE